VSGEWFLQVLWVVGENDKGLEPGSFRKSLIAAALAADPFNLQKMKRCFPELVEAVEKWRLAPPSFGL
jgi:hypothetical protein